MADPRFYDSVGPFTAGQIAELVGGQLADASMANVPIGDIASIDSARIGEIAFLENPKYRTDALASEASALLVHAVMLDAVPAGCAAIICDQPYLAQAHVARALYPDAARSLPMPGDLQAGHAIHPSAKIGANVVIGPGALIGPNAEIGDDTHVGAYALIGRGVSIGRDCVIGPRCEIGYALIGDRVIISSATHIGQDGFGFVPGTAHLKIPQLGRVIVQADVEIQSGCAIDRGALGDTVIGEGSKLDNLVHIAHNIQIGRHCFITAQVGMAGSTQVGDYVSMGGKAGIAGHLTIGDKATIGGLAAVTKNVGAGETVAGNPARPIREMQRDMLFVSKLRKRTSKED